jgi:PPOX class probable F420-dependent enzyme
MMGDARATAPEQAASRRSMIRPGEQVGTNQRSQVEMTEAEIDEFVVNSRTCTLATIGADGRPHLVAMWYAVVDGQIWFETKARSQKAVNLRRDPLVTLLIEDGLTYDKLRGVSIDGTAEVIDDPDVLWKVGVSVWERYNGPYTEEMKPLVEFMLHKRVAVRVDPTRTRSWDHRKLGMDGMELGGTTAEHLDDQLR